MFEYDVFIVAFIYSYLILISFDLPIECMVTEEHYIDNPLSEIDVLKLIVKHLNWLDYSYLVSKIREANWSKCELCNISFQKSGASSTPRDLVLGMGYGKSVRLYITFVRTLRSVNCKASVIILTDNKLYTSFNENERKALDNCGAILISVGYLRPYKSCETITTRHIVMGAFLKFYRALFDRVIVTDLQDTLFQMDPFLDSFPRTNSYGTYENDMLVSNPINNRWIRETDPKYSYEKYKGKYIMNAGCLYGSARAMADLYESYINLSYWFSYPTKTLDQPLLNLMFYDGLLAPSFKRDLKGEIMISATYWYFKNEMTKDGLFQLSSGGTPRGIHQYNRICFINAKIQELCPPLGDWHRDPYGNYEHVLQGC